MQGWQHCLGGETWQVFSGGQHAPRPASTPPVSWPSLTILTENHADSRSKQAWVCCINTTAKNEHLHQVQVKYTRVCFGNVEESFFRPSSSCYCWQPHLLPPHSHLPPLSFSLRMIRFLSKNKDIEDTETEIHSFWKVRETKREEGSGTDKWIKGRPRPDSDVHVTSKRERERERERERKRERERVTRSY